jgi:hypothetical protein
MSDEPSNPPSRGFTAVIGAVMIAAAAQLCYIGATHPARFHAPRWVAYVLGLVFFAGGAQALANALGREGRGRWVAFIFFAGIAAVFWWVAIASDPRECTASLGPFVTPAIACRIGFGVFAALSTLYTIFVARRWFFPGPSRSYY